MRVSKMQVQFRVLTPVLLYILWLTSTCAKEGDTQNEICVYANVSLYNSTYFIMLGQALQWNDAEKTCIQYGMKIATVVEDVIPKVEAVIRQSGLNTTFRAWIGYNKDSSQDVFQGLLICNKDKSCHTSTCITANKNDGNCSNSDEHDNFYLNFIHAFICEQNSDIISDGERQHVDSNCWNYLSSSPFSSPMSSLSHKWPVPTKNIPSMSTTSSFHKAVSSSVLQDSKFVDSSFEYYSTEFSHSMIQATNFLPFYGTVTNIPDSGTGNFTLSLAFALKTSVLYSALGTIVPTKVSSSELMISTYINIPTTENTHFHSSFNPQRQSVSIQTSNSLSASQEMARNTVLNELDHTIFKTIHIRPSYILTTSTSRDEKREMYTPYSVYSGVIDFSISQEIPTSTGRPVHKGDHNENVVLWVGVSIASALVLAFVLVLLFIARKRRKRRSDNGLQISGVSDYLNTFHRRQSSRLSGTSNAGTGKVVMHVEAYNRAFDVLRPNYNSVYIYREPDLGGESDDASEVLDDSKMVDLDSENSVDHQPKGNSQRDEDQNEIPSRSQHFLYADVIKTRL